MASLSCTTERSWILNGEGLARITIAVNDPKVKQSILQYGNLISIEHEALPLWAGVLDTDRLWGDSKLTVTAWSAERLFKFRSSPLNLALSASSAGALYQSLVEISNQAEDTRVRAGEIWYGGTPRDETLDGKHIYDHIVAISNRTGYDWGLEGALDNFGHLYFKANWYQRRGEVRGQQLREGTNIIASEDALAEMGEIINSLTGVGDGSTASTRLTYTEENTLSRSRYGLRQSTRDFAGNKEIGTLTANVQGVLTASKNPQKTLSVAALNIGETFRALRLGNTLPLYMTTVGFLDDGNVGVNTNMRIIGMRYNDDLDQASLVLQEEL